MALPLSTHSADRRSAPQKTAAGSGWASCIRSEVWRPAWTRFELYWPKTAIVRTHNGPCSSISYLPDHGGCPSWVLRRDASRTRRLQDVASWVMIGLVWISPLLRVRIKVVKRRVAT